MKVRIDNDDFPLRDALDLYKGEDYPCVNICAKVDVTEMYHNAKVQGQSMSLLILFYITKVVNSIEALKLRIEGEDIVRYHSIFPGCTILYDDHTFGFGYFQYDSDLDEFVKEGKKTIAKLKSSRKFAPRSETCGLIHCSMLPWIHFSSFQHATSHSANHTIPKIVMGKIDGKSTRKFLPVSIEVHRGLVNDKDISDFFDALSSEMAGYGK